ncbi:MAG: HEAT repeat domain-containing protein, partial [Ilumatobacteraceae bacterium]
ASNGQWSFDPANSAYDALGGDLLFERLGSWSPIVRDRAAMALARRKDAPVEPLVAMLDSPSLDARLGACQALEQLRGRAEPAVPRTIVQDSVACCALGDEEHGPLLAVFVAGIDLDAVPFAADARSYLAPDARLLIVTASRNIVPAQTRMADMLVRHAEFVSA